MIHTLKSFIVTVLIMLTTFSKSNAQWETLRFIDDSIQLPWIFAISFTDVNTGLAASFNYDSLAGEILRTTDGGTTWNVVYDLDTVAFLDVVHTDANTAFCVGQDWAGTNGVIAKTTDAGINWDTVIVSGILNAVSFPSNNIGYVAGENGVVMKTTDAGNTWVSLNSGVSDRLVSCTFVNDTVGFITGDTIILKTTDGGLNWSSQTFGIFPSQIKAISFSSFNTGYFILSEAAGNGIHHIYKTTDNGNQWLNVSTIYSITYFSAACFPTDQIGYLFGQFQMHKSTDGGLTWNRQYASPPGWSNFMDDVTDLFFFNADTGFASGKGQIYRTFVGGDSTTTSTNDLVNEIVGLNIYPNPATQTLMIQTANFQSSIKEVKMFDVTGRAMHGSTSPDSYRDTMTHATVDVSHLPDGLYFLHIEMSNGQLVVRKVVKE